MELGSSVAIVGMCKSLYFMEGRFHHWFLPGIRAMFHFGSCRSNLKITFLQFSITCNVVPSSKSIKNVKENCMAFFFFLFKFSIKSFNGNGWILIVQIKIIGVKVKLGLNYNDPWWDGPISLNRNMSINQWIRWALMNQVCWQNYRVSFILFSNV